ncbi:hypothetical protein G3N56_00465 [Desulfovibrio sulfodismutans]|uniref:NAD(+)--protein-arginine ADP-ribosyltransferase Tre1-like N-terminal domain-containing protein n=1 Tax=Desulfolutivibrio sulfodismutans TaxID=63561 RepID=A0A7K3NGB6_9BACT|nr:hypothetical protein [Desulfolutivibrio sulfodismutans]NDY55218.1 hypothetical protein [Desulfolutivibrio sulfodismutans]QLA12955.1 hypothetical protein GD606_12080 [Desulfolutivibrio sulfodismutans DSM 3696]
MTLYKSRLSFVIYVLLVPIVLFGCGSRYGKQITTVKYYQECYRPIDDLRKAEKQFATTVAGSMVAGVVVGALAGVILSGGKPQGAVAGALAGGLAGTVAGYAMAKQMQIKDDNERMSSYLADLDGDISGLDRVTAAAQVARNCYDQQFYAAVESFKEGKMTRAELDERYLEIKNGSTEAGMILGNVIQGATKKDQQYQEAIKSEAEQAKRQVPEPVLTRQAASPVMVAELPEEDEEEKDELPTPRSKYRSVSSAPQSGSADQTASLEERFRKKLGLYGQSSPGKSSVDVASAETPVKTGGKKSKTSSKPAKSAAAPASSAPAESGKIQVADTGDKLTDMSTRKAKFAESVKGAVEEKAEIEKAEAERQKTLAQLLG